MSKPPDDDPYTQGFNHLPDPRLRAKMSPEKLAMLLSHEQPGTAAYILLEHELNMRLATIQARETRYAAYFGILGVVIGGVFIDPLKQEARAAFEYVFDHVSKAHPERNADPAAEPGADPNTPARPLSKVPSVQPDQKTGQPNKQNPKK